MNLYFLQAPAAGGGMNLSFLVVMVLMFVVMYFFMIRPQQKKQKELKEMRKTLQKGDKILTQGGLFGTIIEVKDTYFLIEIDSNVKVRVLKDLVFRDESEMTIQK